MYTLKPKDVNFKFILFLTALHITIYLIAVSVAYKLVQIGFLFEPGPPFIFPLTYALDNVITEVYGYKITKTIIWLSLFCEYFFAICVTAIIHLPHPGFWQDHDAYYFVFGNVIWFVVAGSIAVISSSFINAYMTSKLKILMDGRRFCLRSIASSVIGGFILVAVIVVIGYAHKLESPKLALYMFVSIYGLEILYALILAWPAWILSGFLKEKEKLDVYDTQTNYNPFSFKS